MSDDLVAFDPDDPHDPQAGPSEQAAEPMAPVADGSLVVCPTCGTGVAEDRLRS